MESRPAGRGPGGERSGPRAACEREAVLGEARRATASVLASGPAVFGDLYTYDSVSTCSNYFIPSALHLGAP